MKKKDRIREQQPLTISSCYSSPADRTRTKCQASSILQLTVLPLTTLYATMGLPQTVNDKEMSGQFKWTNKANAAWQSSTVILFSQCPIPLPPNLSLSSPSSVRPEAEGLLSTLSLGHQAAIVATATDLRVLGQRGGRRSRRRGWD